MAAKSQNNYKKNNKVKPSEQIDKTKINTGDVNEKQPSNNVSVAELNALKAKQSNLNQQTSQNSNQKTKEDVSNYKNTNPEIINNDHVHEQKKPEEKPHFEEHIPTSTDYKKLYEEQKLVLEKTQAQYANINEELDKTRRALENERTQLIFKLEEKSRVAQVKIDERVLELEIAKKHEVEKLRTTIAEETILAFLEPILLFESTVLNSPSDNPVIRAYLQGYNMIINMFKEQLDHLGVEQINVNVGDIFNENYMSAFYVEENPNFTTNQVIRIVSKGFVLKKKIIKYASVVVAK